MNSNELQDDHDDRASTPTIIEGISFDELRDELDERDLANLRDFFGRIEAEARRAGPGEPTRLAALGPFRDLVEIARGGMGVVYHARDPESGEDVAVKVPAPGLMLISGARRMFDKEAEAVRRLDHPAVVPHRGLGESGSRFYIVSDYCDGPDLAAWLNTRNLPVPAREAARIIRDLAGAIAHAHSRGVLHRDVKPSNVLLPGSTLASDAESLSPRLTDFGLAKLIDAVPASQAATATGLIMGSPPYMAPEQAAPGRRHHVDARTDVYGLGAVLYELLTLRPPFRGDTPAETLGMVATDEPVAIRVLRPGVPRSLEAIALQCLEKDQSRRYQTPDALRDDLDAFLAGRRVQARRPVPVERLRRWSRRHPRGATLVASTLGVALILTAGVAAWTVALSRGRDRADQYVFVSQVQLAQRAHEDGELVRAQPILHRLIPGDSEVDRREFAWYYLWRLCRREARMVLGTEFEFNHLVLSPDGSKLAGGGYDGMLVYDMDREAPAWHVPLRGAFVYSRPRFSADGDRLVFLAVDTEYKPDPRRYVEVRKVDTGALTGRRILPLEESISAVGFLPDGRLRVVRGHHSPTAPSAAEIQVWSADGTLADASPQIRFPTLCTSTADALRSVVVTADARLGVFDADGSFTPLEDASAADIRYCSLSEDGRLAAITYEGSREISIYDAETGRLIRRIPATGTPIVEIAFQPGGQAILLRTATHEVRLIDPSRGADIPIHAPTVESGVETTHIRFTPDGRALLVDRTEYHGANRIEVRSAEDGRSLGESPARHNGETRPWAIRRGRRPELVYGLGRQAWRWEWRETVDPPPEEVLKAHNDEAWAVAYSRDGALMATSANNEQDPATIRLRKPDGSVIREWEDSDTTAADLAFAPDASWIATAHLASTRALRIRPTRGDAEVVSVELPDGEWARTVDVDPRRPLVYVGGDRGTILAWDVDRREVVWQVRPPQERRVPKTKDRIHDLAVSPDGNRLAVVDDRGVVRIVDARLGSVIASYVGRSPMLAVAYSPDGRVVAAGDQEGRILILDAHTARLLQIIPGDDCDLRSLAFSPDGRTLAAAGLGRVVRLWDPQTGEELLSLEGHAAQINCVVFSPDGQTLVSADHLGFVRFWRGPRLPRR